MIRNRNEILMIVQQFLGECFGHLDLIVKVSTFKYCRPLISFNNTYLFRQYEKYMIWYMSITRRVIILDPKKVPSLGYMQYEQHA